MQVLKTALPRIQKLKVTQLKDLLRARGLKVPPTLPSRAHFDLSFLDFRLESVELKHNGSRSRLQIKRSDSRVDPLWSPQGVRWARLGAAPMSKLI